MKNRSGNCNNKERLLSVVLLICSPRHALKTKSYYAHADIERHMHKNINGWCEAQTNMLGQTWPFQIKWQSSLWSLCNLKLAVYSMQFLFSADGVRQSCFMSDHILCVAESVAVTCFHSRTNNCGNVCVCAHTCLLCWLGAYLSLLCRQFSCMAGCFLCMKLCVCMRVCVHTSALTPKWEQWLREASATILSLCSGIKC